MAFACTGTAKFGVPVPDDECECAGASGGGALGGASGASAAGSAGAPGSAGSTGEAGQPGVSGAAGCVGGCAGASVGGSGGAGGSAPAGSGGGPTGGAGGAPAGVNLRVVNFNLENLLDTVGTGPGGDDPPPTQFEYDRDIDQTATVLGLLNADVIALQEIENYEVVLQDLAAKLEEKRGVAYPTRWLIRGNDGLRNVALLSTLPVDNADVVSHNNDGADGRFDANGNLQAGGPYSFTRDCLEVTVRPQGYPVTFYVVHYKAKSGDDPARRLAEARRTRQIVNARLAADPNARLVVLGDLNDSPGSPPLAALTTVAPVLTGAVSLLPPALAWTHSYQGNREIIDDQLASPALAQGRVSGSVTVWHDGEPPPVPDFLNFVSDHSPVAITYNLGP